MADTGWVIAGTGANNADAGNVAWSSPGNITADDGTRASCTLTGNTSQYLHATNFGLSLPAGATVLGVEVRVQRSVAIFTSSKDHTIQLIKGGTRSGDNKADTSTNWPTSDTNADYGGPSDLWGLSLSESDVEASNFGVAIRAQNSASGATRVDAVWIRVTYAVYGEGAGAASAAATATAAGASAVGAAGASAGAGTAAAVGEARGTGAASSAGVATAGAVGGARGTGAAAAAGIGTAAAVGGVTVGATIASAGAAGAAAVGSSTAGAAASSAGAATADGIGGVRGTAVAAAAGAAGAGAVAAAPTGAVGACNGLALVSVGGNALARAGAAAAIWALSHHPGKPTLAHLARWEEMRRQAGLEAGAPSPVILPDYTTPQAAPSAESVPI